MEHEDGYCDACGCEVDTAQLTVEGDAVCERCVRSPQLVPETTARRPEARDDGR